MNRPAKFVRHLHSRKLLAAIAICAVASPAFAYTGQSLSKHAKISMQQAEQVVHKALPGGRITDRELERERGGSGFRYSFDVKTNGKTREIGVDAVTGRLLENSVEGPNAD
jgi:uncharacterized membrane protein YkoI